MDAKEAYKMYYQSGALERILEKIKEAATSGHVSTSFPVNTISHSLRKELKLLGFRLTLEDWMIIITWDPGEIDEKERQESIRKFREGRG